MHIAFRPSLYAENNSSALNSTENISRWVQLSDDPIAVASAFLDVPNTSLVKSVGHAGIETWFKAFLDKIQEHYDPNKQKRLKRLIILSLVKLQDYISRDVWVPWWVSHCGAAPSRVSLVHAACSDLGAFTIFKVRLTVNDLVPLLSLSDEERKYASIEGLKSSFNSIICDWEDFSNVPDVLDLNLCLMLKHAIIRDPIEEPSAISRWFEEVVFFKLLKQAKSRSEVKKAFRVLPVRGGSESNLAVAVNACASSENPVKLFLYIISSMRDLEKKNNYIGTSGNWVAHRESIINLLVPDSTSRVFLYSVADNLLVKGTRMGDDLVDEAYEEFLLLCEK